MNRTSRSQGAQGISDDKAHLGSWKFWVLVDHLVRMPIVGCTSSLGSTTRRGRLPVSGPTSRNSQNRVPVDTQIQRPPLLRLPSPVRSTLV